MVNRLRAFSVAILSLVAVAALDGQQPSTQGQDAFRFKSGVELVNVTATVADANGRFVPDLTQDDFIVYEDDVRQNVSQFSAERVPVSLGIALDTSGSMAGEKIEAARGALDRFLSDLLDEHDEVFLYRFSDTPVLLQGWTTNKQSLSRVLGPNHPGGRHGVVRRRLRLDSDGGPRAQSEESARDHFRRQRHLEPHRHARAQAADPRRVRCSSTRSASTAKARATTRLDVRRRRSFPDARRQRRFHFRLEEAGGLVAAFRSCPQVFGPGSGGSTTWPSDDRVNVVALRDMTDDSGGRTEIVRYPRDIDPATASIADELSKQYYLGYTPTGTKDGRWHAIRVELKTGSYRVRARRGYFAN